VTRQVLALGQNRTEIPAKPSYFNTNLKLHAVKIKNSSSDNKNDEEKKK